MAFGFGKNKGGDPDPQKGSPSGSESDDIFDGDTLAFSPANDEEEADPLAFDSDTISLDDFANELEAGIGAGGAASAGAGGGAGHTAPAPSWEDDLLGGEASPAPASASSGEETTLFDDLAADLAAELEGIPGLSADHVPPAQSPASAGDTGIGAGDAAALGAAGLAADAAATGAPEGSDRRKRRGNTPDITKLPKEPKAPRAPKVGKAPKTPGAAAPGAAGGRKLPVVPIVAVVLLLAGAGGGYMLMNSGSTGEEIVDEGATPAMQNPDQAPDQGTEAAPQEAAPDAAAENPAAKPAGQPVPVTPELKARLRKLWVQGRDAKHKKDFAAARKYWQEGLKLDPNNQGFKESLEKLEAR